MQVSVPGRLWAWGICLTFLGLLWHGTAMAQQTAAGEVTLIYSGNIDGELEPCGCSAEGDLGGIRRHATTIDKIRAERPDVFALSAGGLMSAYAANGRLTNEYLLKGFAALDYDAVGVQWTDLLYGDEFLGQSNLPWVASNWHDDRFVPERRIHHGGRTLAFFSWLDPDTAPQQAMLGEHSQVIDSTDSMVRRIEQARQDGALIVVSSSLSLPNAEQRLPMDKIDVLFIRAKYEVFGEPQLRGRTLVLQPGSRGMRIGRVDIELDGTGRIAGFHHEVIPLPKTIGDAPRVEGWYAEYNARVKENYEQMSALRKAQADGRTPFAGEEACKDCHEEMHALWNKSRHARAYAALEDVNKAFDPDCLQCHTVGFNKPGGFIDLEVTASLINVQCESCHGASREHVASGGSTPVANDGWRPEEMCAQCHTQPHSPSFKFEDYWPRIAH